MNKTMTPYLSLESLQLKRLETLMDVIFAVMIWRLFMLLPQPVFEEGAQLDFSYLASGILGDLLGSLVGLVFVVVYWIQSNKLLGNLVRTNSVHTTLMIAQVFFLLLYLKSVGMGMDYEGQLVPMVLQSGTLAMVGFTALIGWKYATKDGRMTSHELDKEGANTITQNISVEPISALVTLPFAFVGSLAWELSWLFYPLAVVVWKRARKRKLAKLQTSETR